MQQYQQALLSQRAQAQRNDQMLRLRQQAMQNGGQVPQGMMNNMQGMNMGNMGNMSNMGNMGNMGNMNMGNMNMGNLQAQQQRMQQQGDMNWGNGV